MGCRTRPIVSTQTVWHLAIVAAYFPMILPEFFDELLSQVVHWSSPSDVCKNDKLKMCKRFEQVVDRLGSCIRYITCVRSIYIQ